MSDIRFEGEWVHVDGNILKVATSDIMLDHGPRRRSPGGHRRALVHDFNDGLTINWGPDYPGGVTINGKVTISDRIVGRLYLECNDLLLDDPSRRRVAGGHRRALVHDFNDGLTINWAADYPGGVTINGAVNCPGTLRVGSTDVGPTIQQLQTRIAQLETRVAALGG